jgi:hypothetical protein
MSELAYLTRLQSPADKEMVVSAVAVTDASGEFTSGLTLGYKRKKIYVYSLGSADSGEAFYGPAEVTALTGMPIPSGVTIELPIQTDLSLWFVANTGENVPLRIIEFA